MAALPGGPIGRPQVRYPNFNPNQLMGGMIGLLLQITQLMMSRFQFGGGYGQPQQPQQGGYPFNFAQPQQPNPFNYGGFQQQYFA